MHDRISAALQPLVERHALAGAVTLVADRERVLSLDTVGFADVAARAPMRPDTVFWIASQTKPITATALMMLVDEGQVRVEDPVEVYLPEFKDLWLIVERDQEHQVLRRPSAPVTLRHLLSHTSGLPFASAMEGPARDQLPLHVAARSYALTPLESEPGSRYEYSNAGINTIGRIIEVVSGEAYEDFLDSRLLRPLGMKDTTFWPNAEQVARLAKPYKPTTDGEDLEETTIEQLSYPLYDRNRQPMPAGGLFSTAGDVVRFCQMILSGGVFEGRRYVSEAAVGQMITKQTGAALADYGLGWATDEVTYGHGGALGTEMSMDATRGMITVFLVQHAGYPKDGGESRGVFAEEAKAVFDAIG